MPDRGLVATSLHGFEAVVALLLRLALLRLVAVRALGLVAVARRVSASVTNRFVAAGALVRGRIGLVLVAVNTLDWHSCE